jgi:hypothetical protein
MPWAENDSGPMIRQNFTTWTLYHQRDEKGRDNPEDQEVHVIKSGEIIGKKSQTGKGLGNQRSSTDKKVTRCPKTSGLSRFLKP